MRRNDFFKYLLLNGGSQSDKAELESETLPYIFKSNSHRLRNYRIYGNTDGVGDLDSTTNKYIIPVTIDDSTTNISLPAPLMKINADSDYIEYRTQKITRKIFKVEANADNIRRTNDHVWYIVKNHPTLKRASGNDTVNIYCNMLSNGITANTDVCFINNTGTIRLNTENAYSTVSDLLEDDEAFTAQGLNASDYGLYWASTNGNTITYGVRYNECLAMECAYLRDQLNSIKSRLTALEGA